MGKIIKEHWGILISIVILIFFVFLLFFVPFFYFNLEYVTERNRLNPIAEYTLLYYASALFSTLVIAEIAYCQLKKINKSLHADYLIKIDERWRSSQIIKARTIIHRLYLNSINILAKQNISGNLAIREKIGNDIKEMSESQDKEKIKDFVYLLNFLDFMETVGYLYTQGHLTKESLNELFGASIAFNYEIFEIYIMYRRKKHDINDFYEEFKKLYKAIQCEKCYKRK